MTGLPLAPPPTPPAANVAITLNAVLSAVDGGTPKALCVGAPDVGIALPYGPFDPQRHRTFEIGLREWVTRQTKLPLGYVEQLYTFGDKGREAPAAALDGANQSDRIISVGYLALAPEPATVRVRNAGWRDWYSFFPWEDWRGGEPAILTQIILPALDLWCARARDKVVAEARLSRVAAAFALDDAIWDEARTLDRYELMYEAGLVEEALRDQGQDGARDQEGRADEAGLRAPRQETGAAMISDHRRILATAVGRLRGKLRYRPILFELAPPAFTLLQLQKLAEAIVGFEFHKQNFRRSVEKSGLIERTGETTQQAGGRPAALFRPRKQGLVDQAAAGLAIPRLRREAERFG